MTKTPKEYFDRWPEYFGQKTGAIDVLLVYKDGRQDFRPSNGCCGWMRHIPNAGNLTAVYGSLWCRNEDLYEAACDYWNYLLGENSPFRKALKGIERIYDNKGRPLAFGLHDMEAPLQVCMSTLIQCRVPQEQVSKLRSYKHWRDNGFTQPQAFFLSEHFLRLESGSLQSVRVNAYHHGFEVHNTPSQVQGGMNYQWLCNGTPNHSDQSWSKGETYYDQIRRCYFMWTAPTSKVFNLLEGSSKYTGKFSQTFVRMKSALSPGVVNPSEAVKILRDNLNEWAPNA